MPVKGKRTCESEFPQISESAPLRLMLTHFESPFRLVTEFLSGERQELIHQSCSPPCQGGKLFTAARLKRDEYVSRRRFNPAENW
jgi:hypothetical protein